MSTEVWGEEQMGIFVLLSFGFLVSHYSLLLSASYESLHKLYIVLAYLWIH